MAPTVKPWQTLTRLGELSIQQFLDEYWQQKPLLIRGAFTDFDSPVSADELAGFAVDDDVESALVIEDPSSKQWHLEHGPLAESRFASLGQSHWTLLIQHANALDPKIHALLKAFKFVPNWRLDDVMVSYATDQGGVGPHFDYYDVFLLQAQGKRRWRLGQRCSEQSSLVPHVPMKILAQFDLYHDWLLEPGDMLYVPANLAHWGTAEGESITYSIGARAPSYSDVLLELSQEVASTLSQDLRYRDHQLSAQSDPSHIPAQAIEQLQAILNRLANDKATIARWFGTYMTNLNRTENDHLRQGLSLSAIQQGAPFRLQPLCRYAYCGGLEDHDNIQCFINGNAWPCSHSLAEHLSTDQSLRWSSLDAKDRATIAQMAADDVFCKGD